MRKMDCENNSPRALMLASVASMLDLFNADNIRILTELGYDVEVAANFEEGSITSQERVVEYRKELADKGITVHQVPIPRTLSKIGDIRKSFELVKKLVEERQYKIVHCHSPIGGVICRLACKEARKKETKVIYTAHGFHFYKGAPLKNWILYFPVEWVCSWFTDVLITINMEDYRRAKRFLHARRTEYVPGIGIDLKKYTSGWIDTEKKRLELGVKPDEIMLLSVGELSERKNHEMVIRALRTLKDYQVKYFICGKGQREEYYKNLIQRWGLEEKVFLLGFRQDISELCQAADLFVFPSHQEGLPVALMEAIACQVPVLCSNIRGNTDLVNIPWLLFDDEREEDLTGKLKTLLGMARVELKKELRPTVLKNYNNLKKFDMSNVTREMCDTYRLGGVKRCIEQLVFKKEWGLDADTVILLSVGELNQNKNHKTVIKAIAGLGNRKLHYFVVGEGDLKKELLTTAQQANVLTQVHLTGYKKDVRELLRKADIFLLPSVREGLNVSLMEAMASGLPCICSDIRGNCDLIAEGKGGYRVESRNVYKWGEAINKLLDNGGIDMGRYNVEQIVSFGRKVVSERMQIVYRQLDSK